MARLKRQKIIVLFCQTCGLPMPFEDQNDTDIFIGKCAICGSENQARRKAKDPGRFEVRPKTDN
ncbi:MAG: hypothetical protein Q8N56_01460 [bacterium]|nr:hypothetical protein [bacterium]